VFLTLILYLTLTGTSNGGLGSNLNVGDPELDEAATRIQAAYRGHLTRKEIQGKKESEEDGNMSGQPEEEVVDIDLNDPGEFIPYFYYYT
jgi:hypothetical protein